MNIGTVRSADGLSVGFMRLGTGRPLVIVHGSLTTAQDWLAVANTLAANHTVYVIDRRGRGQSPDCGNPYRFQCEVDDIAAVMKAVGGEAVLLGHSFGGGVALAHAIRSGFGGDLILYEPGHAVAGRGWFSGSFLAPAESMLGAGKNDEALALIYEGFSVGSDSMTAEVAQLRNSPAWSKQVSLVETLIREIRALESFVPSDADCFGLQARTTLLLGTETPYAMKAGSVSPLVSRIRGVTVLPLMGQGHNCHLWNPQLLADVILQAIGLPALEPNRGRPAP